MNFKFADRVDDLKASFIREVLKSTGKGGAIPLAAGNPSPDAFPSKDIHQIAAKILIESPAAALQYGVTEGYMPLREALRKDCNIRDDEDIIIVSGAQQGIDLAVKALCNEGEKIVCENPSFLGALSCFRANMLEITGVSLTPDGMDINELEQILKNTDIKALYIIPNFQNPTGITTSEEKRRQIYDLACKYDFIIIEDDPYAELRYTGRNIPSIKTLDADGRVIFCGSFSKTLSPGLRVGYVRANKEILQKMVILKQSSDVHTSLLSQMICHEFMTDYNFAAHKSELRALYSKKMTVMLQHLSKVFGNKVEINAPSGGLFVWVKLPAGTDAVKFCRAALDKGAAAVPSVPFLVHGDENIQAIRLNFSTPSEDDLRKGIDILGAAL
ncbi:MAG: PLP-dependent aminotransferase family protein [Oscillospiraceae bacterium]|nr:PLP-dependent aminotransferase family protein [Oscillospiraceae bacterium]